MPGLPLETDGHVGLVFAVSLLPCRPSRAIAVGIRKIGIGLARLAVAGPNTLVRMDCRPDLALLTSTIYYIL